MTTYVQETDSKILYKLPASISYAITEHAPDTTVGAAITPSYISVSVITGKLSRAWELTGRLDDGMAIQAKDLLSTIQQTISEFQQFRLDLSYIPNLQAHIAEDGSVLFEWVFPYYRIGFSIEPNPQESGWFLVTNSNLGEISAAGFIFGIDLNTLVLWLLNFIVSHA